MEDGWAGEPGKQKADGLATIINRLLQNLVLKCAKSEGVRDYYHIGVIGYGGAVGPAFGGALAGKELAPISAIANLPARIEERTRKTDDGAGGLIEQSIKFPVWFDPIAKGGTPMCAALAQARKVLAGWLAEHPQRFPADRDQHHRRRVDRWRSEPPPPPPCATCRPTMATSSSSTCTSRRRQAAPVQFPADDAALPDKWAKLLFGLSSPLPPVHAAVSPGRKGFTSVMRRAGSPSTPIWSR